METGDVNELVSFKNLREQDIRSPGDGILVEFAGNQVVKSKVLCVLFDLAHQQCRFNNPLAMLHLEVNLMG